MRDPYGTSHPKEPLHDAPAAMIVVIGAALFVGGVWPDRRPLSVRACLIVVGLAIAGYGVASLTGGWLGEPPWWTSWDPLPFRPIQGREWISGAVVAMGLGIVVLGIRHRPWAERTRTRVQ